MFPEFEIKSEELSSTGNLLINIHHYDLKYSSCKRQLEKMQGMSIKPEPQLYSNEGHPLKTLKAWRCVEL